MDILSLTCRWLVEEIDPDVAIVAADVLSRQALDAQSEDLALEDTLYALNKALQESLISPEAYMKQVCLPCLIIRQMLGLYVTGSNASHGLTPHVEFADLRVLRKSIAQSHHRERVNIVSLGKQFEEDGC